MIKQAVSPKLAGLSDISFGLIISKPAVSTKPVAFYHYSFHLRSSMEYAWIWPPRLMIRIQNPELVKNQLYLT